MANQTIAWDPLPDPSQGWDGFALLVDDVERYIGSGLNFSLASLKEGIPHFFRLAVRILSIRGCALSDSRTFSSQVVARLVILRCQPHCGPTALGLTLYRVRRSEVYLILGLFLRSPDLSH